MNASAISARASAVADFGNFGVKYSKEKMTWLSSDLVDSFILLMICMVSGGSVCGWVRQCVVGRESGIDEWPMGELRGQGKVEGNNLRWRG